MNVREFKRRVEPIFIHSNNFQSVIAGKKFSFDVDCDFEDVTFEKLRLLSVEFDTTLINIKGGDDAYCDTCGPDPYCRITVEVT
ncbi:MAG: hypothetical protein ACWGQW_01795 [bacterium]